MNAATPSAAGRIRALAAAALLGLWLALVPAAAAALELTPDEQAWLRAHPVVRLAPDPDFRPVEFFDEQGRYQGLAADYARLVEAKLGSGFRFEIVRCASWSEVLAKAQAREVDVLNAAVNTPERRPYLTFLTPWLHVPMVIITRADRSGMATPAELGGRRVALVRNYGHAELIRLENPRLIPFPVPNTRAGVEAVAFGEADAFYHDLATAGDAINALGQTRLRVAGFGTTDNNSGFAVRNDAEWRPFVGLLGRANAAVTPDEYQALYAKWITLAPPSALDALRPWLSVLLVPAVVLWGALASLVLLRREVRRRTAELAVTTQTLRESERRLATLISNLPGIVYRCRDHREWTMEFISDGCRELTGYPAAALVGAEPGRYEQLIHPEDRDGFEREVRAALAARRPYQLTYRIVTASGETRWVWEQGRGIFGAGGELQAREGFIADVTERTRAEETLRRLNLAIEQAADGVAIADLDGTLRFANPAWAAMHGYPVEALIGQNLAIGHTPEQMQSEVVPFNEQVLRQGFHRGEVGHTRRDGSTFPTMMTSTVIRDRAGHPIGLLGTARDITEQKRTDAQLQASLREKETLLREVHHRVKNNMQIVSSLLRLQSRARPDPETAAIFRASQDRIAAMALVHEKLYQSPTLATIDLGAYLTALANGVRRSILIAPRIAIEIKAAGLNLGLDRAIPCGLIVNELLTNSLTHAFPDGRRGTVTIVVTAVAADRWRLAYGDDGVGLPAGFDPARNGAFGLQLVGTLVREQLGGTLESARGPGARFVIEFNPTGGDGRGQGMSCSGRDVYGGTSVAAGTGSSIAATDPGPSVGGASGSSA